MSPLPEGARSCPEIRTTVRLPCAPAPQPVTNRRGEDPITAQARAGGNASKTPMPGAPGALQSLVFTLDHIFMDPHTDFLAIRAQIVSILDQLDRLIWDSQGTPQGDTHGVKSLERTKAIEWVLRREWKPDAPRPDLGRASEAWQGRPKMEVQVTTYDLWQRGRIDRVGRGLYVTKPDA